MDFFLNLNLNLQILCENRLILIAEWEQEQYIYISLSIESLDIYFSGICRSPYCIYQAYRRAVFQFLGPFAEKSNTVFIAFVV